MPLSGKLLKLGKSIYQNRYQISRGAYQVSKAERHMLNKVYAPFGKRGVAAARGAAHGLTIGGIAGSFITDSDNPEMDAQIPFSGGQSKTGPSNKTRYRRRRNGRRYSKCRCRSNRYRR